MNIRDLALTCSNTGSPMWKLNNGSRFTICNHNTDNREVMLVKSPAYKSSTVLLNKRESTTFIYDIPVLGNNKLRHVIYVQDKDLVKYEPDKE